MYLTALKSGEASLSDIARITRVPRSTVMRIAENLNTRGFLDFFVKKRRRVVVAKKPEYIRKLLDDQLVDFSSAIPRLNKITRRDMIQATRVRFYSGAKEIAAIFNDMLKEQREIAAITSPGDTQKILGNFLDKFVKRRIEKKIPIRLLATDSALARAFVESDNKSFRRTQILSSDLQLHTATYIYGNKVAIISLRDSSPSGILIEDSIVAQAQHTLFEILWKQASR